METLPSQGLHLLHLDEIKGEGCGEEITTVIQVRAEGPGSWRTEWDFVYERAAFPDDGLGMWTQE